MTGWFTIGVEEEFHVADNASRLLAHDGDVVLDEIDGHEFSERQFASEIYLSMVETATPVCDSLSEIESELRALRGKLCDTARMHGLRLVAAGTTPLAPSRLQQVTPKRRYRHIERVHQHVSREMMACGMHVHVGLPDRERAVQVLNHVRPYLARLLALSANSPFWDGRDTGFASYRSVLWSRWPSTMQTEPFADADDYDRVCDALLTAGAMVDLGQLYWDVRLSTRHPTIEFRVADVCLTAEEAVLQAALCRALVRTCLARIDDGRPTPALRSELLHAAKWRAARYGLEDQLFDPAHGTLVPADTALRAMLDELGDALDEHGDRERASALLDRTLARGSGARRQRSAFTAAGRLQDAVDLATVHV